MSETAIETRRLVQLASSLVFLATCAVLFVYGGMSALVLFLAAAALSLTIYFLWSSLSNVDRSEEMDFEEALSLAAPSATEEQKRAILRTLKDLEYELSVGKISQEDFDQVSAEYRAEAKRLIYLADEELKDRMKKAELIVEKRLAAKAAKADKADKKKSKKSKSSATNVPSAAASSTEGPAESAPEKDPDGPAEGTADENTSGAAKDMGQHKAEDGPAEPRKAGGGDR